MPALTGRQILLRPSYDVAANGWSLSSGAASHASAQDEAVQQPAVPSSDGSTAINGVITNDGALRMGLTSAPLSSDEFIQKVELWCYYNNQPNSDAQLQLGIYNAQKGFYGEIAPTHPGFFAWGSISHQFTEDEFARDLSGLMVYERAVFLSGTGTAIQCQAFYVLLSTAYRNPVRAAA